MSTLPSRTFFILAMSAMAAAQGDSLVGCYTSVKPLQNEGTNIYQSSGACSTLCVGKNFPVFAMSNGNVCWCGDMLPAANTLTSSSDCSTTCVGWPSDMCGGTSSSGATLYSVWLSGTEDNVPVLGGGSSSGSSTSGGDTSSSVAPTSSTSSTTTSPATRTRAGKTQQATVIKSVNQGTTVYVTNTPVAAATSSSAAGSGSGSGSKSGGGTNVGAVAGGVVVGVAVVAGVAFGVWFYLRRRKQRSDEDEYKRTQVANFMRGTDRKPPNTGYSHSSDSRLDPEAGARRNSQGSIADANDYSRRILRVANPDNS